MDKECIGQMANVRPGIDLVGLERQATLRWWGVVASAPSLAMADGISGWVSGRTPSVAWRGFRTVAMINIRIERHRPYNVICFVQ